MNKTFHVAINLLTGLLLIASHAFAQQDGQAREILDAMSSKYQKMGAFKSDFIYTMENPTEEINEDFQGEIFVKGDKYRLKMGGQEIINDGETVWTYLEDVNEVNIDNYSPGEGDISPSEIFNAYKRGFKYQYVGEETIDGHVYHVIDLAPENTDNQFHKIRLHIDKSDDTLKMWKIFSKDGTHYTYKISNFNGEAQIENSLFTFDTSQYKGVEVIDLR